MKTIYIVSTIYLLIAGNTTYFLGKSLNKHGEHFLTSIFKGRMEIVLPVNKILLIGFYLVNIGFVLLFLTARLEVFSLLSGIEFLAFKLGVVYLVIAAMHFFNILVFILIENKFKTQTSKK